MSHSKAARSRSSVIVENTNDTEPATSASQSVPFDISDMLGLVTFMEPYKLAFAELYCLLCIALVLPATSAACERSFSSYKLIKDVSEKHDVRRSIERYCRAVS